ncbi:SH3-domain-containing protein [Pisolithus sp. B1]|nr:SH3-domain-containing protein [Pisolithus sp. B1]
MAVPSEHQAAVLLAHVASQMQLNVAFLESQNYLSAQDAATMKEIIMRLPVSNNTVVKAETNVQVVLPTSTAVRAVPSLQKAESPKAEAVPVYARALWAYNEDGTEPNDLSFAAGETIEIVSETNEDWWLGRARGREALFPANYVEKVAHDSKAAPTGATTKAYRPFGAALHGADTPPPAGNGVNSIGLQQSTGQTENKNKYGKYGDRIAQSAAGGLGFGAGAAVGGGLVRAIF